MKLYRTKVGVSDEITTTVGGLISELQKMPQDAFVFTEGCDCTGNVVSVSLGHDGTVLIERDDRAFEYDDDYNRVLSERYLGRVEDASQ